MDYEKYIEVDDVNTHYHETGQGETVYLLYLVRSYSLGKLEINDSEAFEKFSYPCPRYGWIRLYRSS